MHTQIDRYMGHRLAALLLSLLLATSKHAIADTYYISADGNDRHSGTIASPFATFQHAISLAKAGDTIYVRGGTYILDDSLKLKKTGTKQHSINVWSYRDEAPILDFSRNPRHKDPPQPRTDDSVDATSNAVGIYIAEGANWWHLKGLTIQNAAYYGVRVYGSYNIFEQLVIRNSKASGLEITGKEKATPSHNLVLNCDSYLNFDPQTNGEDADGFAAKFDTLGPGNVFRGLRAWSNSDDGYDFWHAQHPMLIENCWAFDNGFFRSEWVNQVSGAWRGDGLGFKLGQDASELVLNRVVAFGNKSFGIDENGNRSEGGVTVNHATLVNNAKNGNPVQFQLNDGRPHTVRNTIVFDVDGTGVVDFSKTVDHAFNSWNGIGVSVADFANIDMQQLLSDGKAPRKPDGSLREIGLHLSANSRLINSGTDVGLSYQGAAPDLGAFEAIP